MTVTKQQLRNATAGIVKYLDVTYGFHDWATNDEVEKDPKMIEFRKLWNSKGVKNRARKSRLPINETRAFKIMTREQKDNYIREQIEQGKKPWEIANDLDYSGPQPIYEVIDRLELDYHKTKYHFDSSISEDLIREVSKKSIGYKYMAGILERDYGLTLNPKTIQSFMKAHKMQEEVDGMRQRREMRYLIKDGKTIAFHNLAELARYVGMTKATALNQKNVKHPPFRIMTWEERDEAHGKNI